MKNIFSSIEKVLVFIFQEKDAFYINENFYIGGTFKRNPCIKKTIKLWKYYPFNWDFIVINDYYIIA